MLKYLLLIVVLFLCYNVYLYNSSWFEFYPFSWLVLPFGFSFSHSNISTFLHGIPFKNLFFSYRHNKSTVCLHLISTSRHHGGQEDKKLPPPLPKKPAGGVSGSLRADSVADGGAGGGGGGSGGLVVPRVGGHTLPMREKSLDLVDRQRTEARRRLLQTKRTASFRQNSATESADSIEIYIPEAQTRLWTEDWGVTLPSSSLILNRAKQTCGSFHLLLCYSSFRILSVYFPQFCYLAHEISNDSHFSVLKFRHFTGLDLKSGSWHELQTFWSLWIPFFSNFGWLQTVDFFTLGVSRGSHSSSMPVRVHQALFHHWK